MDHIREKLEKLKCSVCHNLLTVPPIYSTSPTRNVCGRCSPYALMDVQNRQYLFETLMENMTFPCNNADLGCKETVRWNDVRHGSSCKFKKVSCPLLYGNIFMKPSCSWEGKGNALNEHIEMLHSQLILDPPIFSFRRSKETNIFFSHVGQQVITIIIKHDKDNKYLCLVMANETVVQSDSYHYQLEFFDEAKRHSILIRKDRLEPLEMLSVYLNNKDKLLEVDLDKISEMLKSPNSIIAKFGILKKPKKGIEQLTALNEIIPSCSKRSKSLPDEDLLQDLECPICNEFMVPPIHICQIGHSICSNCKLKVTICPTCKGSFGGGRNYTLEKLTTRVRYPCHNKNLGCAHITNSEGIRLHERNCQFSDKQCIFKCHWRGLPLAMGHHIKERHNDYVIIANEMQRINITDDFTTAYHAMCIDSQVFRVSIKHTAGHGPMKFNVQCFEQITNENNSKFIYHLKIVDTSPLNLYFNISNSCQSMTDLPSDSFKGALTIPYDILVTFLENGQYINFKIDILKT